MSYPTPLYFVDFTNKASLVFLFFFFSTARVCLVILELGTELCLRPGFLSPSSFAAGRAQERAQKRWDGGQLMAF